MKRNQNFRGPDLTTHQQNGGWLDQVSGALLPTLTSALRQEAEAVTDRLQASQNNGSRFYTEGVRTGSGV